MNKIIEFGRSTNLIFVLLVIYIAFSMLLFKPAVKYFWPEVDRSSNWIIFATPFVLSWLSQNVKLHRVKIFLWALVVLGVHIAVAQYLAKADLGTGAGIGILSFAMGLSVIAFGLGLNKFAEYIGHPEWKLGMLSSASRGSHDRT